MGKTRRGTFNNASGLSTRSKTLRFPSVSCAIFTWQPGIQDMRRNLSDSQRDSRSISTDQRITLSFDLSGSHVAAMATTLNNPFNGAITSLALDESGSATYLFDRCDEAGRLAISALNVSSDLAGIAVAVPSLFDYSNGLSRLQHSLLLGMALMSGSISQSGSGLTKKMSCFSTTPTPFFFGELQN
jgi:glucokinase